MKESEYMARLVKACQDGKIDKETYESMRRNANVFIDEKNKYVITVAQVTCGNIEVEAINREEAKELALKLAKEDCGRVDWFEHKSYNVAEVYLIEEGS